MLNPPLSLLSDYLINCIVDHVAKLSFSSPNLCNLSITDRAFTSFCQAYIFKDLYLGYKSGSKNSISRKLEKMGNILTEKPSFANRVRTIHLTVIHQRNKWIFNDPTFITIIQLLAKSLMPPSKLHLKGQSRSFIIEDPTFVVGRLMQSFFSQTLTVLDLDDCKNVPLTLFLVCPNLREVLLDEVEVLKRNDEYPDTQCSGRELPALERLNYRDSESLVKQMITPPSKFQMGVIDWSKLRVLRLCPQEKEEMTCLQPILDAACNTLEELYLTNMRVTGGNDEQLSLAGRVNLSHLPCLHIIAIRIIMKAGARKPAVLRDINLVLSKIPKANQVSKLSLDFDIYGKHPFGGCVEEDWVGMCDEVVRISAGKPLALNLEMAITPPGFQYPPPGGDELYRRIKEKIASLSDYPHISTHIWHPRPET